jgi:hemerythrin-like metal-binding protein
MKDFKYPGYHYHKEEHQDFSTKALAYRKIILDSDSKTANEILEYLKKWLVKHFEEADKKSTEYFNKNELK